MEAILILIIIFQTLGIGLGLGSSTIAILNFFAAIQDGLIDESERHLMGLVYIVLRIAMAAILITTLISGLIIYGDVGSSYFTPVTLAIWTLVVVLFLNAFLMTKRVMPSTFGPAIQAGSWYTLGFVTSMVTLGLSNVTYWQFVVGYVAMIALWVAIVNGMMAYFRTQK